MLTNRERALHGKKPWDYRVCVCLPHWNTPEALPVVLELLRGQSVPPYILLIDNGSSKENRDRVEQFRREDTEVHLLQGHAFRHSSAPVTTALDVSFALCRSEYLFLTHTDVFPMRRNLLEWLLSLCNNDNPVVGYEQSPREGTNDWRNVVSHTCTMLHMPTMRRHGISWSFERYWESGEAPVQRHGYPDTEQPFDRCLRRVGIYPYIIGHEPNDYYRDENIEHVRSYTGLKHCIPGDERIGKRYSQLFWAMQRGRERIEQWRQRI